MQQPIMTSTEFLAQPSEKVPGTDDDVRTAGDLADTLAAHADECVGMAANMIGVCKRIIVFDDEVTGRIATMFNPRITDRQGAYDAQEGCLSLKGTRPARRYRRITVAYLAHRRGVFVERTGTFTGFTAQIIQHEIDHCDGVLI